MNEVLLNSIKGIENELTRRNVALRLRRFWYLNPSKSKTEFSMYGFYFDGFRIMKEIKKLQLIKKDLQLIHKVCKPKYSWDIKKHFI